MRSLSLPRLLFRLAFVILFGPMAAFAQGMPYCGPEGLTSVGQSCTPLSPPSAGTSPAGVTPMQGPGAVTGQQPGIPTITNRAPTSISQPVYPGHDPQYSGPEVMRRPEFMQRPEFMLRLERNQFQDFVAQSLGKDLPMFGYNLFLNAPTTFAPVDRVPVTPDYVVGPGDELLIRAWGQVDIDYRAVVDRDGTISIPKVGNVNVVGIRFKDLQGYLRSAIGRVFRNFELNVAMGQLRSIHVFVVGDASRPGSYTVSSLSTLVNALFASGGPTTKGSMRGIQLKRAGKVVTQFDMYDLLLKGDKSKDAPLLPGDVIYIPPIGQLAAVAGSVNNPAIYEVTPNATLADVISLAGGLAATADGQKAIVERIVDRKSRKVEEFSLDPQGMAHPVRNGDVVQILAVSPRFDNVVTVKGNVAVPARHPWRPGITVKDVVPDKDALIVPDYWVKRNLMTRGDVTGRDTLNSPDVRSLALSVQRPELGIAQKPPAFTQERLRSELKRTLPEVNWDYAVVERLNRADLTTQLIPFNLGKAVLEADPQSNLPLQPGDVITVFSKDDIQVPVSKQTRFVRLEGELARPGVYQALPGETLRQLVARVGGATPNAYLFGSTFTRESTRMMQQKRFDEFVDRLEQEVARNTAQTALSVDEANTQKVAAQNQLALVARLRQVKTNGRIVLEMPAEGAGTASLPDITLDDGDTFVVPPRPSTVSVVGTVYNENSFLYRADKTMSDYLAQAGGPTKDADSDSLYVVRADGSIVSKRQRGWLGSFNGERLMPGDTIVVPQKFDKYLVARQLKDWSQIFYQFALGVAGLKVLKDL